MSKATFEDANLVLRLYELRREERMREAREFMFREFHADTLEDYLALCPPGSKNDASARMVIGYWEMAASFVTAGVLNEELFFQSSGGFLLIWTRVRNLLPAFREALGDPQMWANLETVAKSAIEALNRVSPGAYEKRVNTIWRSTRRAAA